MNNENLAQEAVKYLKVHLHPDVICLLDGKRNKKGQPIRHIQGHYVIDRLNQIFGFDGWSLRVLDLREISVRMVGDHHEVLYRATVRLTVHLKEPVVREDVATGSGQMRSLVDAHDLAAKAAVTTAMKRAARTLGSQFGNALYGDHSLRYRDDLFLEEDTPMGASNHVTETNALAACIRFIAATGAGRPVLDKIASVEGVSHMSELHELEIEDWARRVQAWTRGGRLQRWMEKEARDSSAHAGHVVLKQQARHLRCMPEVLELIHKRYNLTPIDALETDAVVALNIEIEQLLRQREGLERPHELRAG